MKKAFFVVVILYAIYAVCISAYLMFASSELPSQFIGTEADPQVFMSEQQYLLATEFSKWRNIIFFLNTPFEWLIYLFVLFFGLSQLFARWSKQVVKFSFLQTSLYVVLLTTISYLLAFPKKYFSYFISKQYGISIQPFESWMKDSLISFWIEAIILLVIVIVIIGLIKIRPKSWWFYTWLLSIPFTLFLMFIQPIVIDPLYNEFYPISDKQLERELLGLAEQANIPAERVYEVKMSEKTNALNAYVTGIGSNLRIVMWDTTLQRLTEDEVLYVMAHEMGHYDLNHLRKLLIGMIILSFLGLFITSKIYTITLQRLGEKLDIKKGDLASFPIILLILSMLSFSVTPVTNYISRVYEYQADRYALELTENPDAAVSTLQKLAIEGLSDVNPPTIVKVFRYTHPPMVERITHARIYGEKLLEK